MKRWITTFSASALFALAVFGVAAADPFEDGAAAYRRGDYATAMLFWRPLADQGNSNAQLGLGLLYANGQGVLRDYAQAVAWYRKAAERGNGAAGYNLGMMYGTGQGVPQDYAQAAKWLGVAAEQGDADAQASLGAMYTEGRGVPQDYAQAVAWYRKAADQGNARAQVNLGMMYANGQGVSKDYAQAYMWYSLAAARAEDDETHNYAAEGRDLVAATMTPTQIAEGNRMAREWQIAAASHAAEDNPPAQGGVTEPEMVFIPGGKFLMGISVAEDIREKIPPTADADARPQHVVTIQSFFLGRTPVTVGQFKKFENEFGKRPDGSEMAGHSSWGCKREQPFPGFEQTDDDPVVCVNADDAVAYAEWLSRKTGKAYRLPSEAEWEYAARGKSLQTSARFWGDDRAVACQYANVSDNENRSFVAGSTFRGNPEAAPSRFFPCTHPRYHRYAETSPVGQFKPNDYGLFDMLGNVMQWTADCWHENYNGAPTDGTPWTTGTCELRVIRGSESDHGPQDTRSGVRTHGGADSYDPYLGFRLAQSP